MSEDVRQWNILTNLPSGDALQSFTDLSGSNAPARFYRVRTP
jgi:hypothetical protein